MPSAEKRGDEGASGDQLAERLADYDEDPSGAHFAAVVDQYIHLRGRGTATRIAGAFATAPSTVTRWASGKTTPHAIVRTQVVAYIRERL